jgi:hypothetical protein
MVSPVTKSGTRRLSELARHLVVPTGIEATSWPAVRDKSRDLGITFDDWQDGAGRLILAKRADGKLAAMVGGVGMSLARQVGKTYLMGALLFILAILRPGLLAIWTAHHSRTSSETFLAMQGFARRRRIAPYVEAVYKGSGDEAIVFRNGSRILFGARERGFGRGVPGVDVLMCDEAQILTDRALDNMLATLNTSSLGLALFVGTPPRPEDPSEAFTRMRTEALSGEATDMVWIEFGADPDASPDDRGQWAMANPSYPDRTPAESILRLRKKLSQDSFRREGLGIWDDRDADDVLPGWDARFLDGEPPPVVAIGLAVSLDGAWGSIGAAGNWPNDERVNVGAVDRRRDTSWMVAEAKRIQDAHDCYVVIDEKCPDASLIGALEDAGVQLTVAKLADYFEACSELVNRVREGQITHQRTHELDAAVKGAAWRWVVDRKVWGRKASTSDVAMLEAVTLAAWKAAGTYDVLESIH